MAGEKPGSRGVKAKRYGQAAAGLDSRAIVHMGSLSVAAVRK